MIHPRYPSSLNDLYDIFHFRFSRPNNRWKSRRTARMSVEDPKTPREDGRAAKRERERERDRQTDRQTEQRGEIERGGKRGETRAVKMNR